MWEQGTAHIVTNDLDEQNRAMQPTNLTAPAHTIPLLCRWNWHRFGRWCYLVLTIEGNGYYGIVAMRECASCSWREARRV